MINLNHIKIQLAFFLIKFLNLFYPKGSIHRFEENLRSYLTLINRPNSNYYQRKNIDFVYHGITHKPWYESCDYDVLKFIAERLKKGFNDIENEWLAHFSSERKVVSLLNASEAYSHLKNEDWQGYQLRYNGKFTETGLALFPKTVKILSELKPFLYAGGLVEFIVMKPGIAIPPHKDDINTSLTCHLGITIPENCGIRVGGETQNLKKRDILFFDNSFEHEAWNKSQEERVILLLELYHPELTKLEKAFLQFFFTI